MKVKELIAKLSKLDQDAEIMILDGFNAGGYPRTINLGPAPQVTSIITKGMQKDCADCEDLETGTEVYVMGYGCY